MSWMGKVVGGAFGFLMGGPLGAILGASVGHQFDTGLNGIKMDEQLSPGDQQRVQMAFFTATFSVMGHIAKADGKVTTAEINLAKRVMDELSLSGDMRKTAIKLFEQGKAEAFPLKDVLQQFRKECHRRTNLIRMFLEIQIQAAFADGVLDQAEEKVLQTICEYLGISRFEYERIKLQFQAQQRFYGYSSQKSASSHLQDAYAILDVDSSATDGEIKKAYRRLMNQHHPDKLVAKGLPEEMMILAKEKTQKITKAYEMIKEQRKK
ncbi:MAG: co-chaperone DjlA [Methylococcales symbiont of Hymedesmia sp. n. MRB-2018]|nr:MAG: co-chaperone DjlA [Methylococcales symbiont of Hymedesmia sp. n. MRB-2018]KAF3983821.1 MAG: co-chaperone DjlA [Methylococcales symbiont of Hymedesmia sp. n. MRB-2018]